MGCPLIPQTGEYYYRPQWPPPSLGLPCTDGRPLTPTMYNSVLPSQASPLGMPSDTPKSVMVLLSTAVATPVARSTVYRRSPLLPTMYRCTAVPG